MHPQYPASMPERTQPPEHALQTDPVTGLPNRSALLSALRRHAVAGQGAGVIFMALDGLYPIIERHGHATGEALLRHLARLLHTRIEGVEVLGLWGGSELLMVTPLNTKTALTRLTDALMQLFEAPFAIDGLSLLLHPRLGIEFASSGFDAEQLVHHAIQALPSPGAQVRWQYHDDILAVRQKQQDALLNSLRNAIAHQTLSLVYQPKILLASDKVIGAEALLRWHDPVHGNVPPNTFIPLAQESGDILAMSEWVLDAVIGQLAHWESTLCLTEEFHVAINIAAQQLIQPGFARDLLAKLHDAGVPNARLSVEVTESGLMEAFDIIHTQLVQLHEAGVGIAIDSFGVGYFSLNYLKDLPVDTLKIDRRFITDIQLSEANQRLARMVTGLAHSFGCQVVAAGIENHAQRDWLQQLGCEQAQGYLFSPPLTEAAFAHWYPCHAHHHLPAHPDPVPDLETEDAPRPDGQGVALQQRYANKANVRILMTIVAGMAHEANNILTTINGLSELNQYLLAADHPASANNLQVLQAGQRMAELITALTQCTGEIDLKRTPVRPVDLMQEALAAASAEERPSQLKVHLDAAYDPGLVSLDVPCITRSLIQLIDNAFYAMAATREPTLTLSINKTFNDQGIVCLLLSVKDNGCGIDDAIQDQVFEAFFTTKPPGCHRGLGMVMVDICTFQHGGDVLLSSAPGHGTDVTLRLPINVYGHA